MFTDPILFPHYIISSPLFLVNLLTILTLYFIMIYSCFVIYLTYMIVDRFGTVLSFYVLYYCIIIQCSSYLATWLPFLINRLDWIEFFHYCRQKLTVTKCTLNLPPKPKSAKMNKNVSGILIIKDATVKQVTRCM